MVFFIEIFHKGACENKDFCNINMPSEDTEISEFNQHHKFDKTLIYYLCRS